MMFGPCCGLKKSSENLIFHHSSDFFSGLAGLTQHCRMPVQAASSRIVLFYPFLGSKKCEFLYVQRGMGWQAGDYFSFSCLLVFKKVKKGILTPELVTVSTRAEQRRVRNPQGKAGTNPRAGN